MAVNWRYAATTIVVVFLLLSLAYSMNYSLNPMIPTQKAGAHSSDAPACLAVDFVAPPSYTAAVVYLASVLPGPRSPQRLFESLSLMQMNIPWRHQWPVLILHAGAYDTEDSRRKFIALLRDVTQAHNLTEHETRKLVNRIEFVPTHHNLPEGIPADGGKDKPVWNQEWPAYHHMCAFYAYKILYHPRIKDLTYFLRLDDDSSILEPACFDPFEYMHVHNKSYAFRDQIPDVDWVTDGMWPFVSNYAQRHPSVERQLSANGWEWPPNRFWHGDGYGHGVFFPSYRTNFDLVKVPRFQTPEMTAFITELASDPLRFYWYRWGDAPVRRAQVEMFLDIKQEVHHMCELRYEHKGEVFGGDCECVPLPG
ncbi:nucleotide-diphospho-sugar transferase [Mycena galericulata]|nr:nucleotide-diphospho-sugar transferase [Mycena galericulata]KAJ7509077.1 nucleotide-diphospho-sugar transferase [Mycena galericulata]